MIFCVRGADGENYLQDFDVKLMTEDDDDDDNLDARDEELAHTQMLAQMAAENARRVSQEIRIWWTRLIAACQALLDPSVPCPEQQCQNDQECLGHFCFWGCNITEFRCRGAPRASQTRLFPPHPSASAHRGPHLNHQSSPHASTHTKIPWDNATPARKKRRSKLQ